MKTTYRIALCVLAGGMAAQAALPPAEIAPAAPETAGFHLKNRSGFTSPDSVRAPFWPVGWSKAQPTSQNVAVVAPVTEVKIDIDQFSVTSILLGRPSLAVINGKAYGEGEFLRQPRGKAGAAPAAPTARVQVQRITDGVVVLAAANRSIAVPLKRPTLNEKKGEDEFVPLSER